MDINYFRKITATLTIAGLVVLSFFLLKSILLSIIFGFILAFMFSPVYDFFLKITKSKNLSAAFLCLLLLALIILPLWFFTPTLIDESIKFYRTAQNLDVVSILKKISPALFASQEFSQEVGSIIKSFITKIANSVMNYFSNIILEFPVIIMQIFVIFFTFFFALRDKDKIIEYVKSLLPFSKEIEKKLLESTKNITSSILYGQVIIGLIQGIILGVGLFIFKIPNPLMLTILAILVGILPIVGPSLVGVPVAIFLFAKGNSFSAFGILIFTLFSVLSDQFLRPLFVAKRTKLHTAIVLVGMIGGFLFFGVLGFILGPLILAYLIIIIEIYRNKPLPAVLIQESDKNK
jgi:predicted PurR-regulated permease PerM